MPEQCSQSTRAKTPWDHLRFVSGYALESSAFFCPHHSRMPLLPSLMANTRSSWAAEKSQPVNSFIGRNSRAMICPPRAPPLEGDYVSKVVRPSPCTSAGISAAAGAADRHDSLWVTTSLPPAAFPAHVVQSTRRHGATVSSPSCGRREPRSLTQPGRSAPPLCPRRPAPP